MKLRVEVGKFVRQDVGVGDDVELFLAKLLLDLDHIGNQAVFSRQFTRVREVVNLLIVLELLVDVSVNASTRPHNVPVVALCQHEPICLERRLDKLRISTVHLVQRVCL